MARTRRTHRRRSAVQRDSGLSQRVFCQQKWQWFPNKGLGIIKLGAHITEYTRKFGSVLDSDSSDTTGWDTWYFPDYDIYLDVSDGIVVSISAYRDFLYKGKNIIGMTVSGLNVLLGCEANDIGEPVEYEDGDIKTPMDYFDFGLQIWSSEGVITSATCLSYED